MVCSLSDKTFHKLFTRRTQIKIRLDLHDANHVNRCGSTLVVVNEMQMSHINNTGDRRQTEL